MSFAQISLQKDTSSEFRSALIETVNLAMRETISIREGVRFATIAS